MGSGFRGAAEGFESDSTGQQQYRAARVQGSNSTGQQQYRAATVQGSNSTGQRQYRAATVQGSDNKAFGWLGCVCS